MKSKTQINLIITCSIGLLAGSVQAAEWKSLIDGSSLAGWEQVGGDARYEVQGDEIVGLTVATGGGGAGLAAGVSASGMGQFSKV